MGEVSNLTWVQRKISPLATKLFSTVFLNRVALASGIRVMVKRLNEREKTCLRLSLNRHEIVLSRYRSWDLDRLLHYHFTKDITTKKLVLAANEFYKLSGRDDFLKIVPGILEGKPSKIIDFNNRQIDYRKLLYEAKPHILRELQTRVVDEECWEWGIMDLAFNLASLSPGMNKGELVYRMRKMADIGGGIQAIVASLFMDVPLEEVQGLFSQTQSKELLDLGDSEYKIIQRYQNLRDHFNFDPVQIVTDRKYICYKMSELIKRAQVPEAVLLFFMHKLFEARAAGSSTALIFNEIRYLYAPLAERLGLIFLADDFRDQHLRLRDPVKHEEIKNMVKQRIGMNYESAKIFLSVYEKELFALLQKKLPPEYQRGIAIKSRVKSPYSIWNKVEIRKEYKYEEVKDILGIKIICDSEKLLPKIRDILKKNDLFIVNPKGIKKVLTTSEETDWRGIKLEGQDNSGIPIEIQLMTQEMNLENNRGKAATWRYNLEKELGEVEQVFDKLEHKKVITTNFVENFYQILNYWIIPVEET